jgi:hypothetical protein
MLMTCADDFAALARGVGADFEAGFQIRLPTLIIRTRDGAELGA